MAELPPLPEPYPYLRTGFLNTSPLPEQLGAAIDLDGMTAAGMEGELRNGLDFVVLGPGPADQGAEADQISEEILTVLIACEAAGIPTILRADSPADLDSPVAAVVSHAVTGRQEIFADLMGRYGPERAFLLEEVVDPHQVLMSSPAGSAEEVVRRRELVAAHGPKAQADRLVSFLGLPAEPEPLVSALIVSRKAEHLQHSLENLRRQHYPRVEPLLVIDPLYESQARQATADWEMPLRIVVSNRRSTLADRLNLGAQHAGGDIVSVIEESALYGPHHLVDLVQAVQHSGAHLVGKASWCVQDQDGDTRIRAPKLQYAFGKVPAVGTLTMARETARRVGFVRRSGGINRVLTQRILDQGGMVFSIHAYDTILLRNGQRIDDLSIAGLAANCLA